MPTKSGFLSSFLKRPWRLAAVVVVLLTLGYFLKPGSKAKDVGATFVARKGPLDITVLEGGSVESEEKGEIKCEVKGGQGVKILKIVEEGYQVTEEDMRTNKVLAELDSADLRNKITQQEITFGSTVASLTDAQEGFDIQLNQNLSDVKAAEQKAAFARMDFEKYMGDQAANQIIAQLRLLAGPSERTVSATNVTEKATPAAGTTTSGETHSQGLTTVTSKTNSPASPDNSIATASPAVAAANANQKASSTTAETAPGQETADPETVIDFSKYADIAQLGDGEAKQKLRELQDAVQIAQKELQQGQSTLDGTKRLFDKDFVTKIELEKDQLAYDNCVLKVKKAETALNLFSKYEFRKSAEEALSKYTESLRELDRTRKGAVSKMAQADAKLKSAQARHSVEERQLKELTDQLDKCVIKAQRPGLVVYGSGGDVRYWRDEEQIREGATVREGQTILTIPDMRKMCIKVKIHETYIKRIAKGQKVHITADAFPDREMEGEVSQVGVLPDSEGSWLNPDMKLYRTTITISGRQDWLRPGMNTKVQIIVNQLADVVHVPVQAISPHEGKKLCYVAAGPKVEQREVEVGDFNDEFIEIKKGLKEGERVCLRSPSGLEGKEPGSEEKKTTPAKDKPKPEKQVVAATAEGQH